MPKKTPAALVAMKPGLQAVAERMIDAQKNMVATIAQIAGLTDAEAQAAFFTLHKAKALKLDPIGGRYTVTHGAFMDADVLRRAAAD
jgi:hypothetical protein